MHMHKAWTDEFSKHARQGVYILKIKTESWPIDYIFTTPHISPLSLTLPPHSCLFNCLSSQFLFIEEDIIEP